MDPLKVAAQFAAYVWYSDRTANPSRQEEEAARFARENWIAFLPVASASRGEALLGLAAHREATLRRRYQPAPFPGRSPDQAPRR
jgi:hypothetical protein